MQRLNACLRSAESGIPTFRDKGGLWRTYSAFDLATPTAFKRDPGLVWEFYSYRREVVQKAEVCEQLYLVSTSSSHLVQPNPAHHAIAKLEQQCRATGRKFTLLTQNIDRLHQVSHLISLFIPPNKLFHLSWLLAPATWLSCTGLCGWSSRYQSPHSWKSQVLSGRTARSRW